MRYPVHYQLDSFDCGPTCLKMVAEFHRKKYPVEYLRELCFITRNGVSLLGITQAAEKIGLRTLMVKLDSETLETECDLPAILYWNQDHFVVLYKISKPWINRFFPGKKETQFVIADPGHGLISLKKTDFQKSWITSDALKGVALLLEPTSDFYNKTPSKISGSRISVLLNYLKPFKKQTSILLLYMLFSTLLSIALPYFTQSSIDKGVLSKNQSLLLLFTLSQFVVFISSTVLDILRSWLLLRISAKISLNIISDFLKKLMTLPIRFFDSKSVGDVSQRINDHHRIEAFLTGDLLNTIFSILNIAVFSSILFFYHKMIWLIFILLSAAGVLWILLFQKKRKKLDYIRFNRNRISQEKLYELIIGMQEIKLYGSEESKRWDWEFLQQRLYTLNIKSLKLEQYQQTGFVFLGYLKNIIVSYLASLYVMDNRFTVGMLLTISFIIGQTNGPISQLVRFLKSAQDAKLSFSRLLEVQHKQDEESEMKLGEPDTGKSRKFDFDDYRLNNISIQQLSFQYQGPRSPMILDKINIEIEAGKVTAIIGASGSGKTTLMKLLLGFYEPSKGSIFIRSKTLQEYSPSWWRSHCGSVMQDGYIFYDTIAKNIALDGKEIDPVKFKKAVTMSNTDEFVSKLPLGFNTLIGSSGLTLSGGQKQRILIARAIYKDPEFLFFDEATSSLDANNESQIMRNLEEFFHGKTVVIIAHRLSTVKNADKIIVLENGRIAEVGNHISLVKKKDRYFNLVKNQLELGN